MTSSRDFVGLPPSPLPPAAASAAHCFYEEQAVRTFLRASSSRPFFASLQNCYDTQGTTAAAAAAAHAGSRKSRKEMISPPL